MGNNSNLALDIRDASNSKTGSTTPACIARIFLSIACSYLSECHHGSFERDIPLPEGLDLDAAKAAVHKGVLSIQLPKTEPSQRQTRSA